MAGAALLTICVLFYLVFTRITRHLSIEKLWLQTAVDNMKQGLLLFDASERLIVCNKRYLEMYGLSDSVIRPGCSLRQLVEHRAETGSLGTDAEEYYRSIVEVVGASHSAIVDTSDGRSIKIGNEPVSGGGWLATHEDVTDQIRAEEKVRHLAYYDQLTGLPNRVLFREDVERRLASAGPDENVTVFYIDVDKFKTVNDSLGHHVGDLLLKALASRLQSTVGPNDLVARLGGDEFAIVTAHASEDDAKRFAATVQENIRLPADCGGHRVCVDSSVGVVIGPQHGTTLEDLLRNADSAMYSAKANGRRSFEMFTSKLEDQVQIRHRIEADLRTALSENGFAIHYQPIVSLATNRITGCEALLRFQPKGGAINVSSRVRTCR